MKEVAMTGVHIYPLLACTPESQSTIAAQSAWI
jgi:hypothetical protein